MLQDKELVDLQADAEATLTDTCIILAAATASNSRGGRTATWAAAGTVPCLLAPLKRVDGEQPTGGKVTTIATRVFTMPAETTVTTVHRVEHSGATYEVTAVRQPRSLEAVKRVECVEVG